MKYITSNVGLFLFCLAGINYGVYAGFVEPATIPFVTLTIIPIGSIGMATAISNILLDSDNREKAK